jgi:hypothetical protein
MDELQGHRRLKAAGILLLFALFLGVLLIVPSMRQAPMGDLPADQPALSR